MLSKVYVIPHGSYEPIHRTEKSRLNKDSINILTIGYQRPSKGLKTFLNAARVVSRQVNNVKFMIVGMRIQKFIERKEELTNDSIDINIERIDGFLEDRILDKVIEEADIIVLPYEDMFYESSGVLHRVALYGKALVCSNIPRFRSSLTNGVDALLFHPRDYMELATHLLRLINDISLREQLSRRVIEKFLHTKWELVARKHEQLFLKILINGRVHKHDLG